MSVDSPSHRSLAGFSLVEALVSLVVISVGMIGVAALYGQGLNAGSTALYRTVAVNLAADMADRIRTNRTGGTAYKTTTAATNKQCDVKPPELGPAVSCTPADMAVHDRYRWKQQLDDQLPNPTGTINYDPSTTPPTYTIDVGWQEPGLAVVHYVATIQVPAF
ncbi:MAG TPA: type IV pilus modification protein PilV [Gammaproteobacteria bacterium]|nr:type IV pilus modification protein PilV [Gammaproteobacteria bacterium]